jgi:hypothetical protein
MFRVAAVLAALLLAAPLAAQQGRLQRVAIQPAPPPPPAAIEPLAEPEARKSGFSLFSRKSKRACVDGDRIGGAIVTDERTVELLLRGGERWRMRLKRDCPALQFYGGFYYRRTQAGKICAGRDTVIARSGGECMIDSLSRRSGKG